jgi:ergothioneine biosynthesis protein EgtB
MDTLITHLPEPVSQTTYQSVRDQTIRLCEPLQVEDYLLQAMPDVSPPKWHLAHTTWFFEHFLLLPYLPGYAPYHPAFAHLFNSYYETAGTFHPRAERGNLSRPALPEVLAYRAHVDAHVALWLETASDSQLASNGFLIELGLHHEQQHQELLLMDTLYNFSCNPLRPVYRAAPATTETSSLPLEWHSFPAGIYEIGHSDVGFAFDNETPRHRIYQAAFELTSRLITNAEFLAFIEVGGYEEPQWWLSDGWRAVKTHQWHAPLYWERQAGSWQAMTLAGMQPLSPAAPVCHLSFYEADAYARWRGGRLPTEAEWEIAAQSRPVAGNFLEAGTFLPRAATRTGMAQLFGDAWEWTQSPYAPYPGFRPLAGSLGEYNGKFMCNQMVLRGGAAISPQSHVRPTYRNFFMPHQRWMMSGLRLARDL